MTMLELYHLLMHQKIFFRCYFGNFDLSKKLTTVFQIVDIFATKNVPQWATLF